jgi:hypothetical protein
MTTKDRTIVPVERSDREVVVEYKDKTKKPRKAGGWHIRMAISYASSNTYHVSMTKSEARELGNALLKYAETMPPKKFN